MKYKIYKVLSTEMTKDYEFIDTVREIKDICNEPMLFDCYAYANNYIQWLNKNTTDKHKYHIVEHIRKDNS